MVTGSPQQEDRPKPKRQTKPKEYVPKKGSANYAFLISLVKGHMAGKTEFTKAELMKAAEDSGLADKSVYGDPNSARDSHIVYDGWSNMKTLTNRDPALVKRWGNPVKVALTPDGEVLASRLLNEAVQRGETINAEPLQKEEEEEDDDYEPGAEPAPGPAADSDGDEQALEEADDEADALLGVDEGAEAEAEEEDEVVEGSAESVPESEDAPAVETKGKTGTKKQANKKAKTRGSAAAAAKEESVEDAPKPRAKNGGSKKAAAPRKKPAPAKRKRAPPTESDESDSE